MSSNWKLLMVALVVIALGGGAWAYAYFGLAVIAPVTATATTTSSSSSGSQASNAVIQSATIGGLACAVSNDGQSALCPGTTVGVGGSESIVVTVQNGGASTTVTVMARSSNTNSWTVTSDSSNPTSLPPGSLTTFRFTANAIAAGVSTLSITIAG